MPETKHGVEIVAPETCFLWEVSFIREGTPRGQDPILGRVQFPAADRDAAAAEAQRLADFAALSLPGAPNSWHLRRVIEISADDEPGRARPRKRPSRRGGSWR
jgi:hypothetical protein